MSEEETRVLVEAAKNIGQFRNTSKRVTKEFDTEYAEYGTGYEVYLEAGVYVKLSTYIGSYSSAVEVTGLEVVRPKEIIVKDFEPVN